MPSVNDWIKYAEDNLDLYRFGVGYDVQSPDTNMVLMDETAIDSNPTYALEYYTYYESFFITKVSHYKSVCEYLERLYKSNIANYIVTCNLTSVQKKKYAAEASYKELNEAIAIIFSVLQKSIADKETALSYKELASRIITYKTAEMRYMNRAA